MSLRRLAIDWSLLERAFTDYSGAICTVDAPKGQIRWVSRKADAAEREAMDRKRFQPNGRSGEIEPIAEHEDAEDLSDFLEDG